MGRSRRETVVALTKTRKHMQGRDKKQSFITKIRSHIDQYSHMYVFSTENMRNSLLKDLRAQWTDSQFFFGRKRVMQIALGRTIEEEYLQHLHKVSQQLHGDVGLLFTNRSPQQVSTFFTDFAQDEFARSGFEATARVQLDKGPLEQFEPNQIQNLRLVGLPVEVKRGVVSLTEQLTVCDIGDVLTPEKAKVLEFFGIRMAKFRVVLRCHYAKEGALIRHLVETVETA